MRKLWTLALVAAGVLTGPTLARADILIDNFNDAVAQQFARTQGGVASGTQEKLVVAPGQVIGNFRELDITVTPFVAGGLADAEILVQLGLAGTSTDAGLTALFEFIYDGGPGSPGLNANLSSGDAFLFEARTDQNAALAGILTVEDNNSSSSAGFLIQPLPVGTLATVTVPFSAFAGIDFSQVKSIVIAINTNNIAEADAQIDNIRVRENIPEPASLAILLGTLAGAGGIQMFRRRKAAR